MQLKCRICYNVEKNDIIFINEKMLGLGNCFEYLLCSHCNSIQIINFPHDIQRYYEGGYYSLNVSPERYFKGKLKRILKSFRDNLTIKYGNNIIRFLFPFVDPVLENLSRVEINKKSSLLDIGCGKGVFLYSLKNAGYDNILGIDPFLDKSILYQNGLLIKNIQLFEVKEEFDFITMHHSFEHMNNPFEVLSHIRKILKPNGVLIVRIPVTNTFAWNKYKENWVQLDAPRHAFIYSVEALNILLKNTGFILEQSIFDSSSFQFWGSELYLNGQKLHGTNIHNYFSKDKLKEFDIAAKQLNKESQGDQAVFYIRRKR